MIARQESDPFGERAKKLTAKQFQLLGGQFRFESSDSALMSLVEHAYGGLPKHKMFAPAPRFRIRLTVTPDPKKNTPSRASDSPPPFAMLGGAGLLGGATPGSTFVVLSPNERSAIVSVSRHMLAFPYNTRYELIEFAAFTLASRAQQMVSLHAACVGLNGRGVLLMGESGSGKSTVALHCLMSGFDFLAEDSVFVAPQTMLATAAPNFLHVRADSLSWLGKSAVSRLIRNSPVIVRRSGVAKFEVNLRRKEFRLAKAPLEIIAVVFLSRQSGASKVTTRRLSTAALRGRMLQMQSYGASLPQWGEFGRHMSTLGGVELMRGSHPSQTVQALRSLLEQ